MKRNITMQLRLFIIVLITSLSSLQVMANEPIQTDQISPCETVGEWTQISEEKSISISYASISCDGETYLAIQFENTSAAPINFVWSLTQNSERLRITEDEMQEAMIHLDSNGNQVYKGTYLVSINSEEDFSDFKVSIQTLNN